MTALSAHDLTRTRLCSTPGCPYEADAGSEKCSSCGRRDARAADRGSRDGAPRRLARVNPIVPLADRKTCRADGCEETSTGLYDRGILANLCATHEEEARGEAGRASAERWERRRSGGRPPTWTRETALDHLRARATDGVAPARIDVLRSGISTQVISRLFGTYTKMVEEAGLTSKLAARSSEPPAPPTPEPPETADDEPPAPGEAPEGLSDRARAVLAAAEKLEDAHTDLAVARDAVAAAEAEYRDAVATLPAL